MKLRRPRVTGKPFAASESAPVGAEQGLPTLDDLHAHADGKRAAFAQRATALQLAVDASSGHTLSGTATALTTGLLGADPEVTRTEFGAAAAALWSVEGQIAAADQLHADVLADLELRDGANLDLSGIQDARENFVDAEDRASRLAAGVTALVGVGPGAAGPELSAGDAAIDWSLDLGEGVALASDARRWAEALDPGVPPTPRDVYEIQSTVLDYADLPTQGYVLRVLAAVPGVHPALVPRLLLDTTAGEADQAFGLAESTLSAAVAPGQEADVAAAWAQDAELITQVAELDRLSADGPDAAPYDAALSFLTGLFERDTIPRAFPIFHGSTASAAVSAGARSLGLLQAVRENHVEVAASFARSEQFADLGMRGPLRGEALDAFAHDEASALPTAWSAARGQIVAMLHEALAAGADRALANALLEKVLWVDDEVVTFGIDNPTVALWVAEKLAADPEASASQTQVAELRSAAALVLRVRQEAEFLDPTTLGLERVGLYAQTLTEALGPDPHMASGVLQLLASAVDIRDVAAAMGESATSGADEAVVDRAMTKGASVILASAQSVLSLGEHLKLAGMGDQAEALQAALKINVDKGAPQALRSVELGWSSKLTLGLNAVSVGLSIVSTYQANRAYLDGEGSDKGDLISTTLGAVAGAVGIANPAAGLAISGLSLVVGLLYKAIRKAWFTTMGSAFQGAFDDLEPHMQAVMTESNGLSIAAGRIGDLMSKQRSAAEEVALENQVEAFRARGTGVLTTLGTLKTFARKRLATPKHDATPQENGEARREGLLKDTFWFYNSDEKLDMALLAFNHRMDQFEPAAALMTLVKLQSSDPARLVEVVPTLERAVGCASEALDDLGVVAVAVLSDKDEVGIGNALVAAHKQREEARRAREEERADTLAPFAGTTSATG